jgi:hypothetical protein
MTRIVRIALVATLALAVGVTAYASEPAQSGEGTPGQTKPVAPPKKKKKIEWSPSAARDTTYMTPPKASEGRMWLYVSGKVINLYCFLDQGADSETQSVCSTARTKGGVPPGLLTQLGLLTSKGEIYILFPNHEWAMDKEQVTYMKPYQRLVGWTTRTVQAGGYLCERTGLKGIEVYESRLLEPAPGQGEGPDSGSASPSGSGSAKEP